MNRKDTCGRCGSPAQACLGQEMVCYWYVQYVEKGGRSSSIGRRGVLDLNYLWGGGILWIPTKLIMHNQVNGKGGRK